MGLNHSYPYTKKMPGETNITRKKKKSSVKELRYFPHEVPNNGLILNGVYLPVEILEQILSYVSSKHLLESCLFVCHKWKDLIHYQVWKLKAVKEFSYKLPDLVNRRLPDFVYQGICCNVAYNNKLSHNSGQWRFKEWKTLHNGGHRWSVGSPVTEGALYLDGRKRQVVNLIKKGIHQTVLDEVQPEIQVSEWYETRWDRPSYYSLDVYLLDKDHKEINTFRNDVLMSYELHINGWHVMCRSFKGYGPGVKYIVFVHTGDDLKFWASQYGSKVEFIFMESLRP